MHVVCSTRGETKKKTTKLLLCIQSQHVVVDYTTSGICTHDDSLSFCCSVFHADTEHSDASLLFRLDFFFIYLRIGN